MSKEEAQFLLRHLTLLVWIKRFADSLDQLSFQMERLWFSLFRRSLYEAESWFNESAGKTLYKQGLQDAISRLSEAQRAATFQSGRTRKLLTHCRRLQKTYATLQDAGTTDLGSTASDRYYRAILLGEEQAVALSQFIATILNDVQRLADYSPDTQRFNGSHD